MVLNFNELYFVTTSLSVKYNKTLKESTAASLYEI